MASYYYSRLVHEIECVCEEIIMVVVVVIIIIGE